LPTADGSRARPEWMPAIGDERRVVVVASEDRPPYER
jgi:hypothetical protein